MKSLKESVVNALDGDTVELYPYLPYILQDLWEIGSSPETIINLIKKHLSNYHLLEILDIGCGKGAVSINIAKNLSAKCYGIDAVNEFIDYCNSKAIELKVNDLCVFKVADCRTDDYFNKQFDVIILGSIGPIFGDYQTTFRAISPYLKSDGLLILDDGYIDDNDELTHHIAIKKSDLIQQAEDSGMALIDEINSDLETQIEQDDFILDSLIARCNELMEQHPSEKQIFQNYIDMQIDETKAIRSFIKCSTMLFKKKS